MTGGWHTLTRTHRGYEAEVRFRGVDTGTVWVALREWIDSYADAKAALQAEPWYRRVWIRFFGPPIPMRIVLPPSGEFDSLDLRKVVAA